MDSELRKRARRALVGQDGWAVSGEAAATDGEGHPAVDGRLTTAGSGAASPAGAAHRPPGADRAPASAAGQGGVAQGE